MGTRTTQEALDALQLLINGEHRLHVPPQATDADMVLGDVIDERDRLRAREAALVAALARVGQLAHGQHGGRGSFRWCGEPACQEAYRAEQATALVAAPGGDGAKGGA